MQCSQQRRCWRWRPLSHNAQRVWNVASVPHLGSRGCGEVLRRGGRKRKKKPRPLHTLRTIPLGRLNAEQGEKGGRECGRREEFQRRPAVSLEPGESLACLSSTRKSVWLEKVGRPTEAKRGKQRFRVPLTRNQAEADHTAGC